MDVTKIPLRGKLGQGKYALVDGDYDGEYFLQFKWYLGANGYPYRSVYAGKVNGKQRKTTIYLHHLVCAQPPVGMVRDHINRDKLDNRSANLRWVTWSESAQNRGYTFNTPGHPQTQTGLKGVRQIYWHNRKGEIRWYPRWTATIQGKVIGTYDSPEEAAEAYRREAEKRFTHLPHQVIEKY